LTPEWVRAWCAALTLGMMPFAAHAQDGPRVMVSLGGGAQVTGEDLTDRREFELNAETAVSEARHPFVVGGLFDAGVSVRVWRRVAVGVYVSYFSGSTAAEVGARLPHPFQFNAHREVSGTAAAARHETAVHVQVVYALPLEGKLRVSLFAGPSFITASQDLVSTVRYDETFPYDTATFAGAELSRASASGPGFHAGADLIWMFTDRFGAGTLIRLTRASLDLDASANRQVPFDAGGLQVTLGARIPF
jgi:hypothetical protein